MDRKETKQHLLQKDWLWQNIFLLLYLQKFEISPANLKQPMNIAKCVDFCRNEDEFCDLWSLIDELDASYSDIIDEIESIRYCKPIPWQYDFVATVSHLRKIPIQQTLGLDAVVTAYTLSLFLPDGVFRKICVSLDKRHQELIDSLNRKQNLLKRNLLMILECNYGVEFPEKKISDIAFREILRAYIPSAGYEKVLSALATAKNAETKLTNDEEIALAFACYSPFFYDEINLQRKLLPPSCMFARVKEYLETAHQYWQKKNALLSDVTKYIDADDFLDNNCVFMDTNEDCIIDARMGKHFFAHVYICPVPPDSMKNYAGDYLVFRNGFLYSVEFVHDFSAHPETADFISRLSEAKKNLKAIQTKLDENSQMPTQKIIGYKKQQYEILRFINNCYCAG